MDAVKLEGGRELRRHGARDRAGRDPRDGPPRPPAAERPPARRLPHAGPNRRGRGRSCSTTRSRSRPPAASRSCSRASPPRSRPSSRIACASRRSGSARAAAPSGQVLVLARPARALRADAALRAPLRAALRGDRAGRRGLPRRRRLGRLPGTGGVVHDRRRRVGRVPGDDRREGPAADGTLRTAAGPDRRDRGHGLPRRRAAGSGRRGGDAGRHAGARPSTRSRQRGLRVHEPDESWSARVTAVPIDRLTAEPSRSRSCSSRAIRRQPSADVLARALDRSGLAVTRPERPRQREALEARLGVERVAAGIAVMGATLVAPGEVRYVPGRSCSAPRPRPHERVERLAAPARAAGIPTVDRGRPRGAPSGASSPRTARSTR